MKSNYKRLGDFIVEVDIRNQQDKNLELWGVSIEKKFIKSVANIIGTDLSKYKIISKNCFVCSLMQVSRDEKIPIARWNDKKDVIVSPAYKVFRVMDTSIIMPEFMDLWFKRAEFDREASFYGVGGVRGSLEWEDFCEMRIPVPPIEEQEKIVDAYQKIETRITLKKKINEVIFDLCQTDYNKLVKDLGDEEQTNGTIGLYCDIKSGYAFKSQWWTDSGYKVIKIANIVENSIELDLCDCVSEENATKSKLFYVQGGDLLIAMTGATTGKIGIVPYCKENLTVNQRVGKFFLGKEPLDRLPFIVCTLLSQSVQIQLHPDGTAGSAQDNLSADDIKNIKIILPKSTEIENFNVLHKIFFERIIINNAEIRSMKKIGELLLQNIACQ